MSIRAILMDLDGTLSELKEVHFYALNAAIREVAGEKYVISYDDHIAKFDGIPTKVKLNMLNKVGMSTKYNEPISKLKQQKTLIAISDMVRPHDPITDMCKYLKSEGYKIACVSNSVYDTVKLALECMGIARYFDKYVSNCDVLQPKPSAQPYLAACAFFGVAPKDSIALEDNINGWRSCARAGCNLVRVMTPNELSVDFIKDWIDVYS